MQQTLWFNMYWPILFIMPFLGLLVAGLSKRIDPVVRGNRVLRHDGPARVAHWSHALGVVALIISGFFIGLRFSASHVTTSANTAAWMNVHFVFACLFLFGTFYWLGNTIISRYRFREHLPHKNAISSTLNHYGALMGFKKAKAPNEEKYFESERLAFLVALGGACLMVVTGVIKVLAHIVDLPGPFVYGITITHDIGAIILVLFLLAHLFFGVVIPNAWPALPSMFTGYMKREKAEKEYVLWMQAVEEQGKDIESESASTGQAGAGSAGSNSAQATEGDGPAHQGTLGGAAAASDGKEQA
ncbi:MAG: cytochrome b/b6 domain-containing protein [Coriobacteriia bacterium]|nr:cytochrome b/b6 domain-containing protein [Coriobacteriia bacterium]